jgi:hypothetical protein
LPGGIQCDQVSNYEAGIDTSIPAPTNLTATPLYGGPVNGVDLETVRLSWQQPNGYLFNAVYQSAAGGSFAAAQRCTNVEYLSGYATVVVPIAASYTFYVVAERSAGPTTWSAPAVVTIAVHHLTTATTAPSTTTTTTSPTIPVDPTIPAPAGLNCQVTWYPSTRQQVVILTWNNFLVGHQRQVSVVEGSGSFQQAQPVGMIQASTLDSAQDPYIQPGHRYTFFVQLGRETNHVDYGPPATCRVTVPAVPT